ncbi:Formin-like protein [Quillaja saponaria]|uniref:Formin-like protein n=1 Tax=Quillaja saponaria TaxID=32244 RepID=A0AAD7LK37_QUISA|nr:Formin-like protein [Quillaja saponaria]
MLRISFRVDLHRIEEKEGLPVETFAKVQEIFSNVDWIDSKTEVANVLQQITASNILLRKLETGGSAHTTDAKLRLEAEAVSENDNNSSAFTAREKNSIPFLEPSIESNSIKMQAALQRPTRSKIISQRVAQDSQSAPVLCGNSLQSSPVPISVYHNAPSALGIPTLLLDHAVLDSKDEASDPVKVSPPTTSALSHSISLASKSVQPISMLIPMPTSPPTTAEITSKPPPQVPQSPPKSRHSVVEQDPETTLHHRSQQLSVSPPPPLPVSIKESLSIPPPSPPPPQVPLSPLKTQLFFMEQDPKTILHGTGQQSSVAPPPLPPPPPPLPATMNSLSITPPTPSPSHLQGALPSPAIKRSSSAPPRPPPPPPLRGAFLSTSIKSSFASPPPSPPPPPSPGVSPSSTVKRSIKNPPLPPPPPPSSGITSSSTVQTSFPTPLASPPLPGVASSASLTIESPVVMPGPRPPPPRPGQSVFPSGPTVISSVLPPPPPPNSASNNSAHVPPPPPPAPFANGLSKAGGASIQVHSGVSNRNAPPAPGPPSGAPFSAKGRDLSRTSPKNQTQLKRSNLKPYHWLKLTRAMQGSLWDDAQKVDEASKAPEFDMSELESLFSTATPKSDPGSTGGKSNRRISGPKSEKVQLIELRRAYNCEIMLTKVKIPLPDLMSYVLALDESVLDVDQVENLIKFCPTKEEMELLKGYNGYKNNLGKCEQFFLEFMKVPRVESKLRVFSFKIQFRFQVSELQRDLNIVNSTSEETRNSVKLKRIMQTILSRGNALNHGTARGSAVGFRLDSLLKLIDTRARNKMTLMHYLCKVLAEKLPELLDFPKDLVSLEAATNIQLKYLAEEMQAISKGLEKVVQELSTSENDGPVSEQFCKTLNEFLGDAEAEVRSLASLYSNVGRNADALAQYFGEDPARRSFEQVVSTLLNFVRMFVQAHTENCKQIEFEKKKAEKEAENEKLKLVTKKESETMIRTPIKNGNIK